jgi:hypothetical protein
MYYIIGAGGIMAKVKCKVCANEVTGHCKVKKARVSVNKPRKCEAYIYDEAKFKAKEELPVTKIGYREVEEAKKLRKMEIKRLRKLAKEGPANKEAEKLGLIPRPDKPYVGGPMTGDAKHPLTGDLSRFMTTAKKDKE